MVLETKRKALWPYFWLFVALALGALVRLWDLTGQSLFIDEGFVFHVAAQEPRQILMTVAHGDFHPPLFYLVTHYLINGLHWPLWDYRYITAAFSLTGIAATWAITRRYFGDTAAAIAALALALDPALVIWDRLYRMYALVVALTAVSWWLLLVCADPANKRRLLWWVIYGVTAIALPYLHYVGAIVVASQFTYAVTRKPMLWPALLFDTAAGVALLPWLWALRIQFHQAHYVLRLNS
ncbi:MAG TPA: glycosyltransferase family 39 protein, partial [Candidatus Acidoferrales bacterium]|nr:glycosyltransferase family 39 protein [Candidatus Acidoferrales bacterium]